MFLFPTPHLHWVSLAEFWFPHPMHLHFAVHFRLAMEHGHDLPFLSLIGSSMQDLVLIFRFLLQLQNGSLSVSVSVIAWAGTASADRKAKRITPYNRPFSKMAAENLNKSKLKTNTSTRNSTLTLVSLSSFSISGEISA